MAKVIKLQIMAGKANPAPPVGPALGQAGLNIQEFCLKFNAETNGKEGIIPVEIIVADDKSYTFGGNDKLMKIISKLDNLTTDKLKELKNTNSYNDYKILKWLYYIDKY